MNNKLIGAGIGLALILVLIVIAVGPKGDNKIGGGPDFKSVKELISKDNLDEARDILDGIAEKNPDSNELGKVYFDLAKSYEKKEEIVKARDLYQLILAKYQNVNNILQIQEKVGSLNTGILFSPIITDGDIVYEVEPGDTLLKIAKKFRTTVDLIKVSNSLKGDTILAHSKLKISTARYKILVDKSQNLLTVFFDDEEIFKVYRVSTGENSSTPAGSFKIVNKIKDPVWYREGAVVPAESPENILGSRWLGLSEKGYGIHGTIDPDSVGRQATQGCIRMYNSDVEELYTLVPLGTEVTIVE